MMDLQKMASQVRRDIVRMVHAVSSGHPGGSLGCTDLLTYLYFNRLRYSAENFSMDGRNEDMFFLSNGHISPVWYSVLARAEFFPIAELATFRKLSSRLQGHPSTDKGLPGIRMASGSLGQGLSVSIGAATSKRLNNDDKWVYCLMGDGELQEGQVWEAAMYASARKMGNLIAIVDYNGRQIDGDLSEVLDISPLDQKWAAFGWDVYEMDGHDFTDMERVFKSIDANKANNKPKAILMKTEMGQGVDFMMGTHKWHGSAPNDDQLAVALNQLPETFGDY
ncbi:MAG: transketolase [Flavobacteriia bacterium]|nr:transketolase [Flavobacteriia bacterium]NBV91383.1 transketolase [Flavobacteriia bacterium]NBY41395.1 transketolase [Flavobacteriia bacterium]